MKIRKNNGLYLVNLKPFTIKTEVYGNGFWSNENRKVTHSKYQITFGEWCCDKRDASAIQSFKNGNINSAELRVFFLKREWNIGKHGLIYTDKNWIKDFRNGLVAAGFSLKASKDVDYSEQGMQGNNYISLDVGKKFLKEAVKLLS